MKVTIKKTGYNYRMRKARLTEIGVYSMGVNRARAYGMQDAVTTADRRAVALYHAASIIYSAIYQVSE